MATTVHLTTPHDEFETLHRLADGRASTVRVDREALLHLLVDHSIMVRALRGSSTFKVTEPAPPRRRARLRL